MKYEDKLLFEYDGGDHNDYIKIFRRDDQPNTGTKIVWQDNRMDPGEYDYNASLDLCARIYYVDGPSGLATHETDFDLIIYKTHYYNVAGP
jgi:hypothetical protein